MPPTPQGAGCLFDYTKSNFIQPTGTKCVSEHHIKRIHIRQEQYLFNTHFTLKTQNTAHLWSNKNWTVQTHATHSWDCQYDPHGARASAKRTSEIVVFYLPTRGAQAVLFEHGVVLAHLSICTLRQFKTYYDCDRARHQRRLDDRVLFDLMFLVYSLLASAGLGNRDHDCYASARAKIILGDNTSGVRATFELAMCWREDAAIC